MIGSFYVEIFFNKRALDCLQLFAHQRFSKFTSSSIFANCTSRRLLKELLIRPLLDLTKRHYFSWLMTFLSLCTSTIKGDKQFTRKVEPSFSSQNLFYPELNINDTPTTVIQIKKYWYCLIWKSRTDNKFSLCFLTKTIVYILNIYSHRTQIVLFLNKVSCAPLLHFISPPSPPALL